ncbi:YXWGXW repeat-containing protein [Cupriavidus agavae]|uniref:YXWGXW repeat-containing protein n=1 Tax=Cupriavidus agavae TaxID=1001822 RepID=A0A4Q7RF78_9BURK|nr:YXWGXW repeat-containing protein [Cupriavidus agavae]RZT31856.1 YXWGXW repeat-containing protein [Cupriavidus agavae]
MKRQLLLAAAVLTTGSLFGLLSPAAQAHGYYKNPPPPRHYEARPAPRPGHAWVPGHYERARGNYAWRGGHWESARPGHRYVPDRWVKGPHGWYRRPGHWTR